MFQQVGRFGGRRVSAARLSDGLDWRDWRGGKATCGEAVLSGWAAQSVNIDCGTMYFRGVRDAVW